MEGYTIDWNTVWKNVLWRVPVGLRMVSPDGTQLKTITVMAKDWVRMWGS